jgi:hypothetical protein
MKTRVGSKICHYVRRAGVFVIAVALIAGMAGCGGGGGTPIMYALTVSSTIGGTVTAPGADTGFYERGTVVNLVATPDTGYVFVRWTGDVDHIDDVTAASTTITMYTDSFIRAHFAKEVWNWHDLHAIRDDRHSDYILMNDLDSTTPGYTELAGPDANQGQGWEPIGSLEPFVPFTGSFDGQGYEIRDLFIDRPDEDSVGLFGCVHSAGAVKNLGVVNTDVIGRFGVSTVIGDNYGTLSTCYSTGNVTGDGAVGGLVGSNSGTMSNTCSAGNVTAYISVGGLVGTNYGTVSRSYSTGSVMGDHNVGGLAGAVVHGGTVSDSYSTSSVEGIQWVGGLVGTNLESDVIRCYSTGSVTGNTDVGGLVGYDDGGAVTNSFWDIETSEQAISAGGTGKTTAEMKSIATFSGAGWNVIGVSNADTRNTLYIWNTVDGVTYPFLSGQCG